MVYFGGRWRKPEPHEARIYGGRRTFVYNGGRWAGRTLNPLVPGSSPGRPPTERNGVSRSPKSTGSTRSKSLVDPKTFGKGLTHVDPGDLEDLVDYSLIGVRAWRNWKTRRA